MCLNKIICRLQGKLYLGIQGHASASVLNPIGNGEGSCNMYCISSKMTVNTHQNVFQQTTIKRTDTILGFFGQFPLG